MTSEQAPTAGIEAVSPTDPEMLLAGIKQFGLAGDGADLRDLASALQALTAENARLTERAEAAEQERDALEAEIVESIDSRKRIRDHMKERAEAAEASLTAAQQTIERLTEARRAADYLIERLNASLSKKPVRDLDEAWIHYNSARAALSGEETK